MRSTGTIILTDVARSVGVSHTTVSRVLNGRANIAEATRRKVLTAAQQLGYRPIDRRRHWRAGVLWTRRLRHPEVEFDPHKTVVPVRLIEGRTVAAPAKERPSVLLSEIEDKGVQ
jgi:DNA-binding LacI/PurR family transcriptional regulator